MKIIVMILLVNLSMSSHARVYLKKCQKYADKLTKIQSQQRAGYSVAKGIKLAKREHAAYNQWWDCKRGKLQEKSKKAKKYKPTSLIKKRAQITLSSTTKSFTNKLVLTSKYSGEKQQRWLDFFKPSKTCRRPKTLKQFAECIEQEQIQQKQFEQDSIQENN